MSDKTKIKEFKISIEQHPGLREQLEAILRGQSDCLVLDCLDFEHLCIEEVKCDCFKMEELKIKRGRINCLKIKFYEPHC